MLVTIKVLEKHYYKRLYYTNYEIKKCFRNRWNINLITVNTKLETCIGTENKKKLNQYDMTMNSIHNFEHWKRHSYTY